MNNESINNQKTNKINKKYLKIGSFSITMTAIVIAAVILVNLFVMEIPEMYTKFDMSELQLYTVGEESAEVISAVDEDVTFYILAQRGTEDSTISELLGKYASLSPRIKVVNIDPVTNPTFISKYTSDTLSQNSVIAESDKRFYCVDYNEIYRVEYSEEELYYYYYYGQMPTGTPFFYGELMLTTALDYVTRDEIPTVYSLTGHGETALSETLVSYITTENIARGELSLLTVDRIPEDCTSILINNPTMDISSAELDMLKAYLDEGGGIIFVSGCINYNSETMPNLTALCSYVGLESVDGIVVEGSRNNYMGDPRYILPILGDTSKEPLSILPSSNIYVLMTAAHGIISDGTHEVTPLLATSSSAYVKADLRSSTIEKEDGDIGGTVYLGASVTGESKGSRSEAYKFVWFSSTDIVDDNADAYVSGGNSTVFISSLNWMSENKVTLSIMAKQLQVAPLTITEADVNIWSTVVVIIIPLALIGLGFAVWLKRRKK